MYGITNAGGGSGTKSTLIISIDSGSTVQVYSNSTYTTLIKTATEKSAGQFWVKGLDNGTYYIKATKGTDTSTLAYTIAEYGVYRIRMAYRTIPEFTYTGSYEAVKDDDTVISDITTYNETNWKIRFLTSGTLTLSNLYGATDGIDVFLVGGGASGYDPGSNGNGGGGGGGYTTTALNKTVATGTNYTITIGDGGARKESGGNAGGDTEAFSESASGGKSASNGGAGGSGGGNFQTGSGGSDGANGGNNGGAGQGTTTREFGEANTRLYSGGGGAGGNNGPNNGGDGGGGRGGTEQPTRYESTAGEANSGGGGGGGHAYMNSSAGGSGIVIIRNARS